jgi:hypothetical protein
LARRSDGTVEAWGSNAQGQCNVPALPPGLSYVEIAAGWAYSFARRSDGTIVAWASTGNVPAALPPSLGYVEIAAGSLHSLARYEPSCPVPVPYCTAKSNSLGCTPSISVVGLPSASFGNGCTLTTANVLENKNGLFFHSTTGSQAAPFHGGLVCVQPPLQRHPVSSSGGSGSQCNGAFVEDFNAYIASGADPALVAGASVWIQHWSRDPADPFGDSLSDALALTICP